MKTPIQLSVPTPCHENWADMTPSDKGRFCASCQKNVIDFTRSSDREIVLALSINKNLCGRFLPSQLERKLYVPKEKNGIWIIAGIAAANIVSLISHQACAQELKPRQNVMAVKTIVPRHNYEVKIIGRRTITGVIGDASDSLSLEGIKIINKNTLATAYTDSNGEFSIILGNGDPVEIYGDGYETENFVFNGESLRTVLLERKKFEFAVLGGAVGGIVIEQKRTFFGRIFHSISNLFR